MPTPPKKSFVRRFFAWSFSRYCDWRDCPAKAAYKHLDKLTPFNRDDDKVAKLVDERIKGTLKVLPANIDASVRGSVTHKLAEDFAKGKLKRLPAELATFKKEFQELAKKPTNEEQQWAFNREWKPVSWFDRNAWLRVMVDEHYQDGPGAFAIIDYKTGKAPTKPDSRTPSWNNEKYFQHQEQREIYALSVFVMYPDCETVTAKHWYLDAGVEHKDTYTRAKHFAILKEKWEKQVHPMMEDKKFAPRPSASACKFCDFAKAKGGPCKY